MKKIIIASIVLSAAYLGYSAERSATSAKETPSPVLKSVSCPPECGFTCQSHDEKELVEIVKNHAKTMHHLDLSDEQIKGMMKTENGPAVSKK